MAYKPFKLQGGFEGSTGGGFMLSRGRETDGRTGGKDNLERLCKVYETQELKGKKSTLTVMRKQSKQLKCKMISLTF